MKRHGAWLFGVHRTCAETAAVSCGTSQASAVSTPLRWIFHKKTKTKTRYKKLVTHVESHASAVGLLKRAANSAIINYSRPQKSIDFRRKIVSARTTESESTSLRISYAKQKRWGTRRICAYQSYRVRTKLKALVYDMLPSTIAILVTT